MISKPLKVLLLLLLIAGAGIGLFFLRWHNERARGRIAELQRRNRTSEQLHRENLHLRSLLTQTSTSDKRAAQVINAEMIRVRGEIADLEKRAELRHAQITALAAGDAEALANNRDPRRGLVPLENFQNAGQTTPEAAFQTLVWAVFKGDDETLGKLLLLSKTARVNAADLIVGLPEDARGKWTPEKLAGLFFTGALTETPAMEISDEKIQDSQHATIFFRIPGVDASKSKLDLQLGASGWQIVVSDRNIDTIRKKIGWPIDATKSSAP